MASATMEHLILSIIVLAVFGAVNSQHLEQLFPGIDEAILSNPDFSRFTEILLSDAEKLPLDSSTNLFVPTNRALEGVTDFDSLLRTSALHRRHFLATHFIEGSQTLGLEQILWVPSSFWIQTPRFEWFKARRVELSSLVVERVYIVDRPILPYWFDYSNVTTALRQFNLQTSSLLVAEEISAAVPFGHTFMAPMDEAFPKSSSRLLEAFPDLSQHLSHRLSLEGIVDYDSALGTIATVSGSFVDVERTNQGISFDGSSRATDYMLVQRGLVYLINNLPASFISLDFLQAQYSAFPNFRTYLVPTYEGLGESAFNTYINNRTAFATHINRFVGYHTTAIPSYWITSSQVSLPMADQSTVGVLSMDDVLYIRSSNNSPSRTVDRVSSGLMVLNRFLTPEWMQRDHILQYVQAAAPHFAFCASMLAADVLSEAITVFVPTHISTEWMSSKDIKATCRNHFLPYVVNAADKEQVRSALVALNSERSNVISFSLTKLGVVYQVDRLLLPSQYPALLDPPPTQIRLFDRVINRQNT